MRSRVPCCSYYRQTNAEGNAQACPCSRRYRLEKGADLFSSLVRLSRNLISGQPGGWFDSTYVECFAGAGKEHI